MNKEVIEIVTTIINTVLTTGGLIVAVWAIKSWKAEKRSAFADELIKYSHQSVHLAQDLNKKIHQAYDPDDDEDEMLRKKSKAVKDFLEANPNINRQYYPFSRRVKLLLKDDKINDDLVQIGCIFIDYANVADYTDKSLDPDVIAQGEDFPREVILKLWEDLKSKSLKVWDAIDDLEEKLKKFI